MISIENKAYEYIKKNGLLDDTSKVYVATSGGADSMALLAFMEHHKKEFGIEVGAVHVNHGIRGETARRDADFVQDYCLAHNIEYILFDAEADKVNVPDNASEEWARQLRYSYLDSINKEGTKIATAHTLSDQTETILFRLARGGSGLKGLTGIPAKRGNYIRPFLCLCRAEIEQLVEYYGTGNITDETNLGDDYSRNRIRHYVVPELKRINENAEASIGKACERISKAQAYIKKQAKLRLDECKAVDKLVYETWGFIGVDEIIVEEMILQLLSNINAQNEQFVSIIKEFLIKGNYNESYEVMYGELPINDTTSIVVTNEYVSIKKSANLDEKNIGVGVNQFGDYGYRVIIRKISIDEFRRICTDKSQLCNFADANKLDLNSSILRGRQEGDKFKPACKIGGKLGRFMSDIPLVQRDHIPLVEHNNNVVWLWGAGFTDGFTPTANTVDVYQFISE